MSYPRQESVGKRLHKETLDALESTGAKGLTDLAKLWRSHRKEIQLAILNAYRAAAPKGKWTLSSFKATSKPMLDYELQGILERFRALSNQSIKNSLNGLYKESVLRHAYIVDQLTPGGVMIPHSMKLHESARVGIFYGAKASKDWSDKWSAWVDSYRSALTHNLALGASNNSPVSDAVAEVDATKSNTPQSTLENAMIRLYDYAATAAMIEGEQTVTDMNDDSVEEEIWKTRGDLRVCDDCDANEGLTMEEADGTIPLHPNCHCYYEVVPKEYAELLRSGDEDDRLLARDMDNAGLVPTSLVIRNDQGDIAAKAIVSFNQWQKGNAQGIFAQ